MKIDCEIIKDLLPLYIDGICSDKSKELIEEHIKVCDDCNNELQLIQKKLPLNLIELNLNEAEAVKKISKEWKKGMAKSLLQGIFITAIFALILFLFLGIKVVPN
ncbi:hypothetical protein SH1V18_31950 [Vallitalea longa]|uniref:Putative zinc-finger domain-containing protein n=1 Tax=Vallitalea longa TaxID=2936439 RepID=A0A9W5YB36_9FIRM|nr:zf-HC2 domain-containing protein [Vallitalea longa]GKX30715.1 hypothetical protein SH1V18_31950 [Vallitalea longa]